MANTMEPNCITSLWIEYSKTKGLEIRNKLVEVYLGLVRFHAYDIRAKLPKSVKLDDLVSAGVFGLMDAIRVFNIYRGIEFKTYCRPRIRGAILDELRAMDWIPQLVRKRNKKYKLAIEALSNGNGNGNMPTLQEIADYLKVSIKEAEKIIAEGNTPIVCFCQMAETPRDKLSNDSFNELISCLRKKEQDVVSLYYRGNYKIREIGAILGLPKRSIYQMRSAALKKIKKDMSFGKSKN